MSAALQKQSSDHAFLPGEAQMLVTMRADRQLFGIPVQHVRAVLKSPQITPIPLAPPEVIGAFSQRGRVVTVIDLRRRLKLPVKAKAKQSVFVVVEQRGELFSLMADAIGEALTVSASRIEKAPSNLDANWRAMAMGICRLESELLMVMDIHALLDVGA